MKLLLLLFIFFIYQNTLSKTINELEFHVFRNDNKIGNHKVNISEKNNIKNVSIEINFKVKFLGFSIYNYSHRNTEKWVDGKLINLESSTDKNGLPLSCKILKKNKNLISNGSNSNDNFNIDSIPTSYWNHALVEGKTKKRLINTQDCSVILMDIEKIGQEKIYNNNLIATHYKMKGKEYSGEDVDIDIWYDEKKNWVKMIFLKDGSQIEYILNKYYEK